MPTLQLSVAPERHLVGRTDADELAHAEGLLPRRLDPGFVATDPAEHRHPAIERDICVGPVSRGSDATLQALALAAKPRK